MIVEVRLIPATGPARRLTQRFAGCADVEDGKRKARVIFPGCMIVKAAAVVEEE